MGVRERLRTIARGIKERIVWAPPESVGSALIADIEEYWDNIAITMRFTSAERDLAGASNVRHLPKEWLKERRIGGPDEVRVALRPFSSESFGVITPEDRTELGPFLKDPDNRLTLFLDRGFFRRFLGANVEPISPEDIQGPGSFDL